MRRRARRIWVGTWVCLLLLALLGASDAVAATTSWKFETSAENPEAVQYFGQTLAGGGPTEPREYVLANTGETPITIERSAYGWETPSEPHLWTRASNSCKHGATIEPGQTCSFAVVFDPLYAGWSDGFVRVEAVNGEPPLAKVEFQGHAIGPWVEPEPERLDFGPSRWERGRPRSRRSPSPTKKPCR